MDVRIYMIIVEACGRDKKTVLAYRAQVKLQKEKDRSITFAERQHGNGVGVNRTDELIVGLGAPHVSGRIDQPSDVQPVKVKWIIKNENKFIFIFNDPFQLTQWRIARRLRSCTLCRRTRPRSTTESLMAEGSSRSASRWGNIWGTRKLKTESNSSKKVFTCVGKQEADPILSRSCWPSRRTSSHRDASCTTASPCARRRILCLHCADRRSYLWICGAHDGLEPTQWLSSGRRLIGRLPK